MAKAKEKEKVAKVMVDTKDMVVDTVVTKEDTRPVAMVVESPIKSDSQVGVRPHHHPVVPEDLTNRLRGSLSWWRKHASGEVVQLIAKGVPPNWVRPPPLRYRRQHHYAEEEAIAKVLIQDYLEWHAVVRLPDTEKVPFLIRACAQCCIFSIVRANFPKYDLYSAPIARALPRYIVPFFKFFKTGKCFKTMLFPVSCVSQKPLAFQKHSLLLIQPKTHAKTLSERSEKCATVQVLTDENSVARATYLQRALGALLRALYQV